MIGSLLQSEVTAPQDEAPIQVWVRRLVWKIAIATLLLMVVGSATRVMNAGLACPDWPLCYGQLIPRQQMNLQVFLEWFHRLDAALIGTSTLALVGISWWWRRQLPSWLPWAATFSLGLIVFQGVLGGLTVTQLLRFDIVTAHLGTALLFFGSLIGIGCCLTPYLEGDSHPATAAADCVSSDEVQPPKIQNPKSKMVLAGFGLAAALLIYLQSLLGGLVASRWAVHQCLAIAQLCAVTNSHLLGVIPATLAIFTLWLLAWRTPALNPWLRQLAALAAALVALQILLGVATFRLHLQVEPLTVAHHTVGALLFGALVAFTTFSCRELLYSSEASRLKARA